MVGSTERQFTMTIGLGNAAFEGDGCRPETASILRGVADCVERGDADGPIFDRNGKKCGDWEIDENEPACCSAPDLDEHGKCLNCATEDDRPGPPWNEWKTHQIRSGCWQAVRDRNIGEGETRDYDVEEVVNFHGRSRRWVLFDGQRDCEHRCNLLNSGLASKVRDERSSFPVPSDEAPERMQ